MGRSGSSSKRKSSTKKSLKKSSEARRKKGSKRSKSRKLHHHDDSVSSYSDDDSTRSSLVSSSSSEGEYESRRARSRTRYEAKHSRKRTRRSPSEESNKKRKGSKKKDGPEAKKTKKKKNKKKNSRRDAYVSSSGSDSSSCSTCRGGDSSSSEGEELEKPRGRPRERKRDHKDSLKGRNERRSNRSKHRSRSYSYNDESIEKLVVENNPRRLKSVITVVTRPEEEEGTDMNKDELKEEIVYDYDDYPSCRSNDSNDGGNKNDHHDISSEKRIVESVIGEAVSASSPKDMNSVKENVDFKQKEGSDSANFGSEGGDLELILRQKALENLSRFRGSIQTKARVPVDAKVDLVQSPSQSQSQGKLTAPKQDDSAVIGVTQPVIERRRFTWKRDTPIATVNEEKGPKLEGGDPSLTIDAQKSTTVPETPPSGSNEEGGSKEQQTETKDSSQFEQKTMSVMRGGEMVQVSYKVYIPKKAPALARRQLKR